MTFKKTIHFNCYFSAQMTISENSNGRPTLPRLTYLTDDRLDIVKADQSNVVQYLRQSKQI